MTSFKTLKMQTSHVYPMYKDTTHPYANFNTLQRISKNCSIKAVNDASQ